MIIQPVQKIKSLKNSVIINLYTEEEIQSLQKSSKKNDFSPLSEVLRLKKFTGKKNQSIILYGQTKGSIDILFGLGQAKKLQPVNFMDIGAAIFKEFKKTKSTHLIINPPTFKTKSFESILEYFIQGVHLAGYEFNLKTDKKNKKVKIDCVLGKQHQKYKPLFNKCHRISNSVNYTRDLVNENASVLNPDKFVKIAQKLAKEHKMEIEVLNHNELQKQQLNLLYAVGQGAPSKPKLITLKYYKGNPGSKTIAFIGKGITFDSGGLNLKPTGHIEDMRMDMAGAGAVLGALKAIAELKMKVNVIGVLAVAENALGSNSYHPGDIYKSYNGKTVEILNTDAEGRLALADAISYTEKNQKPDYIIDLATLTGAALIALGEDYAALLTEDEQFKSKILKSAEITHEKLWPLPFNEDFFEDMKSDCADLRNIGKNRYAGTIRAAVFLKSFVDKAKWAHLDIAGPAWGSQAKSFNSKYATGYGVRLLTHLAQII